ncbi:MAG: hypothetical protein ACYDDF_12825 [Thermoplasmatota archaeon]
MADEVKADRSGADFEELAGYLNALANPGRLELLSQLRFPRTVREITLRPGRDEAEGNPDRAISRTAVERHLTLLKAIGVVTTRPGERDGRHTEEYVLQRARLFQTLERLRELMQLQPVETVDLDRTEMIGASTAPKPLPTGSFLTLLSGPYEGRMVPLEGGDVDVRRSAPCHVVLDYDPFVSSRQFTLRVGPKGSNACSLEQDPSARNPTLLNWSPVGRAARKLATGDIIKAGHSLILFRAGH